MSAAPSKLAHLRGTFAAFVVTGVAFIFAFGSRAARTTDTAQHYVLIAAVVGLMFLYGVFLWLRSRARLSTEADGETFYYLGFIFTLATLVATFMPLLWTEARADAKQVLGLFGLGLITTFVGLAGRIFYYRLSEETGDTEYGLQRVARAAESAARSIEAVSLQIQRSAEGLETSMAGGQERLTRTLAQGSERLTAELVAVFKSRLDDMLREFQGRLHAIELPPEQAGARISAEIDRTLETLAAFNAGLGDSSSVLGDAKAQFAAMSIAAAQTKNRLDQLARSAQAVASSSDAIAQSVERGSRALDGFSAGIEASGDALARGQDQVFKTAAALARELDQGRRAWKTFVEASAAISIEIRNFGAAAAAFASAMQSVARSAEQSGSASEAFAQEVDTLAGAAQSGSQAAVALVESNREAARVLDEFMALVRSYQSELQGVAQRLSADVAASHEAVQKVHQNLVASASLIVQRLS